MLPLLGATYGPTSLPAPVKEIVILRVSAWNRCRYCVETHSLVGLEAGLTESEIRALRQAPEPASHFGPLEQALIAFSDALCDRPEQAIGHLLPRFRDHEIVELVTLGTVTIMLNRFCTSLGLPTSEADRSRLEQLGLLYA
jgi:AhpD family alkylhydroperoxidase